MWIRRFALLFLVAVIVLLSPKPDVFAQGGEATAATESEAMQTLRTAEVAFERGRPDYVLARRALEQAEATDDLLLQARANRLQARLDSAGRRYSRALPYYHQAAELELQAQRAAAAEAIAAAQQQAEAAEAARLQAESIRTEAESTLEEQREAASWKYMTVIGICLVVLALGILAFLATVRKMRGDTARAREGQQESDTAYAEARNQLSQSSRAAMKMLRRIFQTLAARMPATGATTPANQLHAQSEALGYLAQSSFEQGDKFEVAMEAFFEKYNPTLTQLLNPHPGLSLRTEAMPLRLPLDQAVPVALIYTELVDNAFRHGGSSGQVLVRMTKEGNSITMTVKDPSGSSFSAQPAGEGRKLVAYLAEEIGGKIDYPSGDTDEVRLRFKSIAQRGAAASIM